MNSKITDITKITNTIQTSIEMNSKITEMNSKITNTILASIAEIQRFSTGQVAAPDPASMFWAKLKTSDFQDGVLALDDDAYFLGDPSFGRKLFMRQCYPKLTQMINTQFKNGKRGVILSGNPGCNRV